MRLLLLVALLFISIFFFFNDTATTEIYTLSLHDALPISQFIDQRLQISRRRIRGQMDRPTRDRKSTRLNSSHGYISYAVFCLKKKKIKSTTTRHTRCDSRPLRFPTPSPLPLPRPRSSRLT